MSKTSSSGHQEKFQVNKATWNQKVDVHARSEFYDLESFRKGRSSLNRYELNALGDVAGKSLLHLQCHFGQDTMSWSRMGANCVGVDISDKAIELAEELSRELNLDARFVCCNVLDTRKHLQEQFDLVFTSYGTIGWLPDLAPWAKVISESLKPGGKFYMVEFHPICWMFDYQQQPPALVYGYQQSAPIYEEYEGSYTDGGKDRVVSKEYGWNHGLGQIISSLQKAGLVFDYLNELDESPYNVFPGLIRTESGYFGHPQELFPLLFELQFSKA
ncbi:class I SAM-dependent methyltransferase [Aureitalea marina]|uniref:SAM-dependent methyltransferase n=1 Tax=Aureitalea marina TaxID=930804 RepID=A0A2S7KM94_9FLAO|nr:class I SAM-dependent methyltransferase [Aureitalea marina]PQB03755.1 SAM-dependent methyltransferase [Aureitalea marina]